MSFKETGIKILSTIFGVVVVFLLIWGGMNLQKKQEAKYPWRGTLYATAGDSSTIRASDEFKTVDDCRTWAKKQATTHSLNTATWGFSCGTNCTWKENNIVGGKQIKQYECSELVTE